MLRELDRERTGKFLKEYFSELSHKGYVNDGIVFRFIMWLFAVDLVEFTGDIMTANDYTKINDMLECLFRGKNCLLPAYSPNRTGVVFAPPVFHLSNIRVTENDILRRKEEEDNVRFTEGE